MTHIPKRAPAQNIPAQFTSFSAHSQTLQPLHHCPSDLPRCTDPCAVLLVVWLQRPAVSGLLLEGHRLSVPRVVGEHRGSTAMKALHALEQSGLQAGLSPFGLFHCFLYQGVKLRKIWPGKSKALHSMKERNSCRIPGTANVNRAPLAFVQLKGWASPPPGCRTLISLTTVIPPA